MTDEEIAREFGLYEDHGVNGKAIDVSVLAAIAAARADERERCLQVCAAIRSSGENTDAWTITRDCLLLEVENGIRALTGDGK